MSESTFVFYTDGSYSDKTPGISGFGVSIYERPAESAQEWHEQGLSGGSDRFSESRQIGGECEAVLEALKYAIEHKLQHVEIVYDYIGVEKWATFKWVTKKDVSQNYLLDFLDLQQTLDDMLRKENKLLNLTWRHVKGHSNVEGNEAADKLANQGRINAYNSKKYIKNS